MPKWVIEALLLFGIFLAGVVAGQNVPSWRDDAMCDNYTIQVESNRERSEPEFRAGDYTLVK